MLASDSYLQSQLLVTTAGSFSIAREELARLMTTVGEPIALEDYEELMDLTGYGMNSGRRLSCSWV